MANITYSYILKNDDTNEVLENTLNIIESSDECCFSIKHNKDILTEIWFKEYPTPYVLKDMVIKTIKLFHSKVLKQTITKVQIVSKLPNDLYDKRNSYY